MKLLWMLAWRNLWRNRRRTLITALAIGLSVAMMSFTIALTQGMISRIVRTATESELGDAQIHSSAYVKTREETALIGDLQARRAKIKATRGVRAVSARIHGLGLLAIGDRVQGVKLIGVNPADEQTVTTWSKRLGGGKYLSGPDQIMLGHKVAQKLDVEVGAKLVLTTANIHTGESTSALVELVAILSTGSQAIDQGVAVMEIDQAARFLGLKDQAHELALRLDVPNDDRAALERALGPLHEPGLSVRPWQEINKMAASALALMDKWLGIFVFIIFGIIAFGIVNTLSMSLAERTHEFGVMRALGTSRIRMIALILLEALCLGLVGALPGAVLGLGLSYALARSGISLISTSAYGISFIEPLVPEPDLLWTLRTALLFAALTMLTSVVGALRVARLNPATALRQ